MSTSNEKAINKQALNRANRNGQSKIRVTEIVKKIVRKPYTFRFDEEIIEDVRASGVNQHRDLTNHIEYILANFVKREKAAKPKNHVNSKKG